MADVQDMVVLGGGAGGFAAAMRAAQLGGTVTVVEEAQFGGNCMNHGCIPLTHLMVAARMLDRTRQAARFGIRVSEPQIDMQALHERKDLIVESLRLGTEQQLVDYGVSLVQGRGRVVAPDLVEVNGQQIQTRNVVVATGSIAAPLSVEGGDLGVMGTADALELREIPSRMVIVGGQPWDIELAQYFQTLSSQVTLIVAEDQLLPDADYGLSQRLAKLLHDAGIDVRRRTTVQAIRQNAAGELLVVLAGGQEELLADQVLASRRLPNSTGLGLRQLGVKMERGAIVTDERMRTSVSGIYAIGDVVAGPMRSHKAQAEGLVAAENAMGLASRMNYDVLPHCAYTWPQVAWVGLSEDKASALGIDFVVGKVPLAINPQAMILNETAGEIKVLAAKKYGKILGVHMVAAGAIDLISVALLAMLSESTVAELRSLIPWHPSIGEALVDAVMDVEKRSLHLPRW
jgi:dihydrolipoamide dehydrogenase